MSHFPVKWSNNGFPVPCISAAQVTPHVVGKLLLVRCSLGVFESWFTTAVAIDPQLERKENKRVGKTVKRRRVNIKKRKTKSMWFNRVFLLCKETMGSVRIYSYASTLPLYAKHMLQPLLSTNLREFFKVPLQRYFLLLVFIIMIMLLFFIILARKQLAFFFLFLPWWVS